MNIISKRFVQCLNKLKEKGLVRSSRQFALSVDYLPQSLSEIIKGRRDVTLKVLEKSIEVYSMNPHFLFTGKGAHFYNQNTNPIDKGQEMIFEHKVLHVPASMFEFYCRHCHTDGLSDSLHHLILPNLGTNTNSFRSFEIVSEKMTPSLHHGEVVIGTKASLDDIGIGGKSPDIIALVLENTVIICRLQASVSNYDQIDICFDNKRFARKTILPGDIREIWKIEYRLSKISDENGSDNYYIYDQMDNIKEELSRQKKAFKKLRNEIMEIHTKV